LSKNKLMKVGPHVPCFWWSGALDAMKSKLELLYSCVPKLELGNKVKTTWERGRPARNS